MITYSSRVEANEPVDMRTTAVLGMGSRGTHLSAMHKLKLHPLSRFSSHRIHFSPHITMRPPLTLPNISSSGLHTAVLPLHTSLSSSLHTPTQPPSSRAEGQGEAAVGPTDMGA